jgi:hypothetical protein
LKRACQILVYRANDVVSVPLARSDTVAGDLGHAGEMLDAQAKAAYQLRLTELEDELEEARELGNEARAEKAEDEIEALGQSSRAPLDSLVAIGVQRPLPSVPG